MNYWLRLMQTSFRPTEMSAETLQKITGIFLRETPRRFQAMHTSLKQRDAVAFGIEAHALKGNARYFNATMLGELAAKLETLADRNELDEIELLLLETEESFDLLRNQLMHPLTV